jgi:hypothetical protein
MGLARYSVLTMNYMTLPHYPISGNRDGGSFEYLPSFSIPLRRWQATHFQLESVRSQISIDLKICSQLLLIFLILIRAEISSV